MADYHADTKRRIQHPDRSLLMSAYVKINVEYKEGDDLEAKKMALIELSNLVANVVHRNVETEVLVREGSVIAEVIASGHLHELLSLDNLKAIGVSIAEGNIADSLLSYAAVRTALLILVKDIRTATSSLSMYARYIFSARLGDVIRIESRTGVVGSLKRFIDACDVARSRDISVEKRRNAMKRAYQQIVKIDDLTENQDDRTLAFKYCRRELNRIKGATLDTAEFDKKYLKVANEFNEYLSKCRKIAAADNDDTADS